MRAAFEQRLMTLSAAHGLLTDESWDGAPLDAVARASLRAAQERVSFEGEDLRLKPKSAVALSMALHELGTNALKYGALSVEQGSVTVRWSTSDGRFRLRWEEKGGPPVSPPAHRGFGSRMIERAWQPSCGAKRASTGGRKAWSASSTRRWRRSMRGADVRRVLVVEDEVLVGMLIEEMLQELGYELAALSTHLEEALSLARTASFDFAVLDINLNGKQSFPVADVVRARGLPFVFATGYGSRILGAPYKDTPILQKPFSL
ncbi:hypothetical protein BH10PSE6_BH10PSE6_57230 [soil metagenome]